MLPESSSSPHHHENDAVKHENAAQASQRSFSERVKATGTTIVHHAKKHTGVGIVCAVAYFDP
ncbi:hypothetical protein D9615_000895 [Tricholomella constricta]|uniref:Uncharacterized protein n=1 Tax=Tricholomella constricta TaxID=117010 RepID=A0A8H5M8Z7_9AGAR|nr:hypothetical protein D9615_000895 [Tricholomella constricta]